MRDVDVDMRLMNEILISIVPDQDRVCALLTDDPT
jgi:hypothetical protein